MKNRPEDYKAIAEWGRLLLSYPYYIKEQQALAAQTDAPIDALYEEMVEGSHTGRWITVRDLPTDHPFLETLKKA